MDARARILIFEDDPLWVNTLLDVLKPMAAHWEATPFLQEAVGLLQRQYFNLAIVDLSTRLGDPQDSQGMELLKALKDLELADTVKCVVCSAYGDVARVRQVFHDYQVVDFVDKNYFNPDSLTSAVDAALAGMNLLHPAQIVLSGNKRIPDLWATLNWAQREDPFQLEPELTDLLLRLFDQATILNIQPMATGQSGAGVVKITPTFRDQVGAPVVVKYGKRDKILDEKDNYTRYIERYLGPFSSTQLRFASGRLMGAAAYSFLGTETGAVASFASFYRRHGVQDITAALDNLFRSTCGRWYDNREQPRRLYNLVTLYEQGLHLDWAEVHRGATASGVDLDGDNLAFPGLEGEIPNPLTWLSDRDFNLELLTWRSVVHGDLNETNIFVTESSRCWLVDFYRTGPSHILADMVELELAIKLKLTATSRLADYAALERSLLTQSRLDQFDLPASDHPHYKPLAVLAHLRRLADVLTGSATSVEEYKMGLLMTALKMVGLEGMALPIRQRALLAAGMMCGALASE